jgi:hypothetical protein
MNFTLKKNKVSCGIIVRIPMFMHTVCLSVFLKCVRASMM